MPLDPVTGTWTDETAPDAAQTADMSGGLDLGSLFSMLSMPSSAGPSQPQSVGPTAVPQMPKQGWAPLLAVLPALLKGGPGAAAAFLHGVQQARQSKYQQSTTQFEQQRQLGADQRAQQQLQALEAYRQQQLAAQEQQRRLGMLTQARQAIDNATSPEAISALSDFYRSALGPDAAALQTYATQTATPTALQQRQAKRTVAELEKQHGQDWAQKLGTASFQLTPGSAPLSVQELLSLSSGVQMTGLPQKPAAPDVPNTIEEKFYQKFAEENGFKNFEAMPTTLQFRARKTWNPDKPTGEPRQRFNVQQYTKPDGTTGLLRVNMDTGEAVPVKLPEGAGAGRPSDTERLSAAYYDRTAKSNGLLAPLETQLLSLGPQMNVRLPNLLQSEAGQLYKQAKDEFINASLRRESGAAIQPSEYERYDKIYFVIPGDTPATIRQKQAARARVVNGFRITAGDMKNAATAQSGQATESAEERWVKNKAGQWERAK